MHLGLNRQTWSGLAFYSVGWLAFCMRELIGPRGFIHADHPDAAKAHLGQVASLAELPQLLAQTIGGDLFLAFIAAVAFATILAVVAGLTITASSILAHDFCANVMPGAR